MKNKKFLCLVLALVMVLGAFGPVFAETKAADDKKEETKVEVKKVTGRDNKIQYLVDNKYVEGRKVNEDPKNNDLALDKTIKRSEITKLLVYAIGRQDLAEKVQGVKIYSDVEATYWANGVITVGTTMASPANNVAFLNGYPDGSFKPENDVTYGELAKMLVTLVKKDLTKEMHDKANKPGVWPAQWITWAAELGILEDVKIEDANKPAVRSDAFVMLYNALYALKYVNKFAATDELGILSQLKNKKLTLNQGDKKKEYTITDDTTFVLNDYRGYTTDVNAEHTGYNVYSRVVHVWAIDNPAYYYGSLMRVITDDKGNVTHVLELGNPDYLALGNDVNNDGWMIDPNNRWKGVADATVETSTWSRVLKSNENDLGIKAAKFHFNNGEANEIAMYQGLFVRPAENDVERQDDPNNLGTGLFKLTKNSAIWSAKLDKNTRYFVADVEANQLTEVKNVDEALLILGYTRNSNWFLDVYVGYDKVGGAAYHETSEPSAINGYNVAKVVVLNSVQRDNNNAQLLRVKNEATRLYDATFEKTDGTEVVLNLAKYRAAFPFNYNDTKYNVVEITENAADGIKVELKIKHNDKVKYPIVKVIEADDNYIIVEDEKKNTARLALEHGYDQFLENQKLVGKHIQFRTATNNTVFTDPKTETKYTTTIPNRVEIISIVPHALEGVLQKIVFDNQENQEYGWISPDALDQSIGAGPNAENLINVKINQYHEFYNKDKGTFVKDYFIDLQTASQLQAYLNLLGKKDLRYKVQTHWANTDKVFDFEVRLPDGSWIALKTWFATILNDPAVKAVQGKIDALADVPSLDEAAIKDARDAYNALNPAQKQAVNTSILEDREAKVDAAAEAIAAEAKKGIKLTKDFKQNETFNEVKTEVDGKVPSTANMTKGEATFQDVKLTDKLVVDPKEQTVTAKIEYTFNGITRTENVVITYNVPEV